MSTLLPTDAARVRAGALSEQATVWPEPGSACSSEGRRPPLQGQLGAILRNQATGTLSPRLALYLQAHTSPGPRLLLPDLLWTGFLMHFESFLMRAFHSPL